VRRTLTLAGFVEIVSQTEERGVSIRRFRNDRLEEGHGRIGFKNGYCLVEPQAGVPETTMGSCPVGRDSGQRGRTAPIGSGA